MFTNMLFGEYHFILTYKASVSQLAPLAAQICPYYNVWPGAVYCCFNENYNVHNIFNMTLHAGLVDPTCLQSFTVWYCLSYASRIQRMGPMGE